MVDAIDVGQERVLVFGADAESEAEIERSLAGSRLVMLSSHDADYVRVLVALEVFSCVIVDIEHQDDAGESMARWILTHASEQRVFVISNNPGYRSAVDLLLLGAADYLPKPISIDDVRKMLAIPSLASPKGRSRVGKSQMEMPEVIAGYEVRRFLGEGMSSVVFEVRLNGQKLALKLFKRFLANEVREREMISRFLREASILLDIRHPHVIQAVDTGCTTLDSGDAVPYIVMEYVDGTTLLDATGPHNTMIDMASRCGIIGKVADGLQAIHDAGIIHRDVKPSNIVVGRDGTVKLMDLGVAHLHDSDLTCSGDYLGSPAFMAPEMFLGVSYDRRVDIYALGVTAYFFFLYEMPYRADTIAGLLDQISRRDPTHPGEYNRHLPEVLTRILASMLDRDPANRFSSAREVDENLQAFRRHPGIDERALPHPCRSVMWMDYAFDS